MKIDPADLRKAFDKFAGAPAGKEWLENIGFPGWLLLIASALQLFCGYLMLFTIIWSLRGLRWMAAGITFRPYRQSLRKQINANLDTLQIIPACGIIVGPTGNALVLGSFSPIELKVLTSLAEQFAEFYSDGSDDARDAALLKLLRDDVYQANRRRRVPDRYAQRLDLLLFDTALDLAECSKKAGGIVLSLAVTPGESGVHVHLPWKSVKQAFGDETSDAEHESSLETTADPGSYIEHLERLGTVSSTPIVEKIQGHPPLKIHVVTDADNDRYLVTEGMSARAMTVPPGGKDHQYAEVAVFLRDNWPLDAESQQDAKYHWPITWLRKVARDPHQNQTWQGGRYAIIANGEPPAPLGPGTKLTCLLVIQYPGEFGRWVREDGGIVVFYNVIPLYTEERDFEKLHGLNALMGKFQSYGISPWVNPNRVNTCLLTEDEEADIDAKRARRNTESDTYALAASELDSRSDDLDDFASDADLEDEDAGLLSTASNRKSGGGGAKSKKRDKLRQDLNDQGDVDGRWWIGFLKQAGNTFAIVVLAILVGWLFPVSAIWLTVGFVLGAIGLLVRAWVLPFRHALQHDKLAAALFIFPWYFIKYGVSNWPKTRGSVLALGLFLVWVSSPIVIGVPIQLIANLLPQANPGGANGEVAVQGQPRWEDLPKPKGVPGARPQDPDLSPTMIRQELGPDGKMLLTLAWGDGTVGSWSRPLLTQTRSDPNYIQRQADIHRRDGELYIQLHKAELGAVIAGDTIGGEGGLIYGGQDGIYSLASSPSNAAVHAGLIKVDQPAKLKLTIVPRPDRFPMLEQNGLISIPQGRGFEKTAYKIELDPQDDG